MMNIVFLGEVAHVAMGSAPPSLSYNSIGEGLPLIAGAGDYGEKYPVPKKWTIAPTRVTEIGDLIVCVRATIGDLNWADKKYCLGRGVAGLRPKKGKLDINFAAHYINAKKNDLAKLGTGSTFLAVRRADLENFPIPLPPLPEQNRIAAILDKADAIRRKRLAAIKLVDDFLLATFLDMFGDPVINPKGWNVIKVIDVCGCIVPGRDKPKSFTGDIPWITTDDLDPNNATLQSKKNIALSESEIMQVRAKIIPKGSVLMTCVGDLGLSSIAGVDCVVNQQLHSFQCSEKVNSIYLMYNISLQKPYMHSVATLTTVPYLNKANCNAIPLPLPPIELQQKYGNISRKIWDMKKMLHRAYAKNSSLFNSLTQRAFRGEL